MFGHVQANLKDLTPEEKERYQAAYCGLCRTIKERHGQLARMGLSYDLTFLSLLLSSLYEPEEKNEDFRCLVHPGKKRSSIQNEITEYAADMTVALTYYKCLDDWKDDRNLIKSVYAQSLKNHYQEVRKKWPRQCRTIETQLEILGRIEKEKTSNPDAAANCFGHLLEELFVLKQDEWECSLRALGYGLGRYIYFADAVLDYDKDRKHGSYNPMNYIDAVPEDMRPTLEGLLGEASNAFEFLPLVQDASLLRNILYSGIWLTFNNGMEKRRKKNDD